MRYDRLITLSVAGNRWARRWPAQQLLWSAVVERLKTPVLGKESLTAYLRLSKSQQDDLKDVGGFVGGKLRDGLRRNGSVEYRDLVTLDMDSIPAMGTQDVLKAIDALGCAYAVYSTRKHEPARPRLRVLIPMSRSITADEYEPIARQLGQRLGMAAMDPTTFQAVRMMYWPSLCADGEYIFHTGDRPMADADGILRLYVDWHDISSWPVVPGMQKREQRMLQKQEDPTLKNGVIGAFCRTYSIEAAMDNYLPGVYLSCGENRYTYAEGSTTGGAITYNGKYLYSHHATDPASEKLCNAFDLVRLHRFGDRDSAAEPGTPVGRLPSYTAMTQLATEDPQVRGTLLRERAEQARADFGVSGETAANATGSAVNAVANQAYQELASAGGQAVERASGANRAPEIAYGDEARSLRPAGGQAVEDENWQAKLAINSKGVLLPTSANTEIIMTNDPLLRGLWAYDRFSVRVMVMRRTPWASTNTAEGRRPWTDGDNAGLRCYLEQTYGLKGKQMIDDVFVKLGNLHAFDDVESYIQSLQWDGIPRVDQLLVRYMGAEDTAYTRAVTRKSLVACVARALRPGIKFDYVLTLVGKQGLGKSTLIQMLGRNWFNASLVSFDRNKDASELIQGSWVVELGELASLNHSELTTAKQFITRTTDRFRAAYGRYPEDCPRRCVFFGTTNKEDFLRDETGERRFWPVAVSHKMTVTELEELASSVDQIWAEAKAFFLLGERLFLDDDALEAAAKDMQLRYREDDGLEGMIREFLNKPIPENWYQWTVRERRTWLQNDFGQQQATDAPALRKRVKICAREVWAECLGKDLAYCDTRQLMAINKALTRLEWDSGRFKFGGEYGQQRGYIMPGNDWDNANR